MSKSIDKESVEDLMMSAREAAESAYCPYSKYPVGAALLGVDGEVYTGCNVENVSYGLSMCAERTAVFNAVGNGCRRFIAMALAGGKDKAATPCGACRQVLSEFCDATMPVFYADLAEGEIQEATMGELLPLAFKKK
ncbi:MAG: cytidine deaminase [Kiritimatiellae bacterium]|jgi:cytidine deaminase|nr:cytidine deaminase [Kiritimatiellia bacterium]